MRQTPGRFVNGGVASFALRELRALLSDRRVLAGLVGASLILGVAGPFNTLALMGLVPRMAYWAFVVFATFSLGCLVSLAGEKLLATAPRFLRHGIVSLGIGLVVTLLLFLLNAAIFGPNYTEIRGLLETFVTVTFIAAVIEIGMAFGHKPKTETNATPPAILKRMPLEKRGTLLALSATDHYVNVSTTAGSALILMRLADAIAEAGGGGLQVHRSHWVAIDQVRAAKRAGDRAILTLTDGSEIPVSRSYLPAIRAAGLLEK